MEKIPGLSLIILLLVLLPGCRQESDPGLGQREDRFTFVVYTDPGSDCLECGMFALGLLDEFLGPDEKIEIVIKKTEHNENFKRMLRVDLKHRGLVFIEKEMKVPHPSVLLLRGSVVYMYLYIPKDAFKRKEFLDICRAFFLQPRA